MTRSGLDDFARKVGQNNTPKAKCLPCFRGICLCSFSLSNVVARSGRSTAGRCFRGEGGGVHFEAPRGRISYPPPLLYTPQPLEGYFQGWGGGGIKFGPPFLPLFRQAPDTVQLWRHTMTAILAVQPKCSHRCVSLKNSPLKPVLILNNTTKISTEQTSMRMEWFKHIAI